MNKYEETYNMLVADAKAKAALRSKLLLKTPPKPIEPHIVPKWDDDGQGYGMFNARLNEWVREEFQELHPLFRSPDHARGWYRELI